MGKPRYEYSEVTDLRGLVEERLHKLPTRKSADESSAEFWSRVERAGLLLETLVLYDELTAARSEWKHTRREKKKEFDQRMRREGRQAEAKRLRAELLASGMTKRQAQVKLVERLQPLDGSKTRAWETPDPWQHGRLFKKKADQQEVLKLTRSEEDEDGNEEVTEAEQRLLWAELRRDERQALLYARQRARAMKLEQEKLSRPPQQCERRKAGARGRQKKRAVPTQAKEDWVEI
jgi:hypothetical protein